MQYGLYLLVALLAATQAVADSAPEPAAAGSSPAQTAAPWHQVREVDGVLVEARPTVTGFDAHRARIHVCTDMSSLAEFVVDPSRFVDWIAFTRSARLLEKSEDSAVYYVRSTTPWPLKDADMVYRIARNPTSDGLNLSLTGLPDYLPSEKDATRIHSANGMWRIVPDDRGLGVSYELYVNPGSVLQSFANQRLAAAVGKTLANLAAHYPCVGRDVPP